jgi:hypothetical protein
MPDPFVAQLGRISGPLLTDNLVRDGIDLSFRNRALDLDLLYLNVSNDRIGINTDSTAFSLDVVGDTKATSGIFGSGTIGNITFQNPARLSTTIGPINIIPQSNNPTVIFDSLGTTDIGYNPIITFNDNVIQSYNNNNIIFNPNANGNIQLQSNSRIDGNLTVTGPALSGNIIIGGNLSTTSNIIVGDTPLDVVVFESDFTQDIIPGSDLLYDLGKADKRWALAYIDDWSKADNLYSSLSNISNQTLINGISRSITSTVTNADLLFLPSTENTNIENIRFNNNTILNTSEDPLLFQSSGIGYYRFSGSNGVVLPSGRNDQRPTTPQLGDTRWNTDLQFLECFDGSVYISSIGPGENVTQSDMEDLGNVWTLILG